MGDIGDNGSGQLGVWSEVWRCEVAVPVVHLKLSPDSLLFATAGEVSNESYNEHLQIFICERLTTKVFLLSNNLPLCAKFCTCTLYTYLLAVA